VVAAVLPKLKFGRPVVRPGGWLAFREAQRSFSHLHGGVMVSTLSVKPGLHVEDDSLAS